MRLTHGQSTVSGVSQEHFSQAYLQSIDSQIGETTDLHLETRRNFTKTPWVHLRALAWAMGITALIIKIMDVVWPGGIRVTPKEEEVGLDLSQHGERAYVTE